jgi:hypothetical protein
MSTRQPISFGTNLNRFLDECDSLGPQHGRLDAGDLDHLTRWASDHRAEAVWRTIQKLAWDPIGIYDPLDAFIVTVLIARQMAESIPLSLRTAERRESQSQRYEQFARESEERVKFWSSVGSGNHPKSASALNRADFHRREARLMRAFAASPLRKPPFMISRVDINGSRKQRAFMEVMSKYMYDLCGRHLDSEVAILTDIAFGDDPAQQPIDRSIASEYIFYVLFISSASCLRVNPKAK